MLKLKRLRDLGATIILLHHTPKDDDTQYLGASVIYSQVDHVLAMYPIKQAGNNSEAVDDSEKPRVYRFGTKGKTRFAHHKLLVQFDGSKKLFVKSDGPDHDVINLLLEIITECEPIKQIDLITNETVLALVGRNSATRVLKQYVGVHWDSYKGENNSTFYTSIRNNL